MVDKTPLIGTGFFTCETLANQVAVVTGAGRGIGYEAARALLWLGAKVIIAEIDKTSGKDSEKRLAAEFGPGKVLFIHTDVGDEGSIQNLKRQTLRTFGRVDIILNNACGVRVGAVIDTRIKDWDFCYHVNLRGPVLLAQAFLPAMIARDCGAFVCVSSKGEAFMGPYETYKAAQVHLADTLAAELEGANVSVFTIGPGLVHTPGADENIVKIAPMYGKSVEEFYAMSKKHIIPVEAAGTGFAAAIALASQFRGQEISSIQALNAAGISLRDNQSAARSLSLTQEQADRAAGLCRKIRTTLAEQADGWKKRPVFERNWAVKDFRKYAGMPVEQWIDTLDRLGACLAAPDFNSAASVDAPLDKLVAYFQHTQDMYRGYEKNPEKLKEYLPVIQGWQQDTLDLVSLLNIQENKHTL
jgi:NAD(P)-dependent dehydrogenase (short-subunit alcohol dehydrogenase family)